MTPETVIDIGRDAIYVVMLLAAPHAALRARHRSARGPVPGGDPDQRADAELHPKLLVMFVALIVSGSWLLAIILDYTRTLITEIIPRVVGG